MTQTDKQLARAARDERRAEAREKARQLREQQLRQARRRRLLLQSAVVGAVLAVLGVIVLVIATSVRPPIGNPANLGSDGIVLTGAEGVVSAVRSAPLPPGTAPRPWTGAETGVPHITLYVDYHCPHCNEFERVYGGTIASWLEDGKIALEVHPVSIVGTPYSSRSANAAVCVAAEAPDSFFAFHQRLFEAFPADGAQPDAAAVTALAGEAGATSGAVGRCIREGDYGSWVSAATARAAQNPALHSDAGRFGTPTVLINGERLADLGSFVTAVQLGLNGALNSAPGAAG